MRFKITTLMFCMLISLCGWRSTIILAQDNDEQYAIEQLDMYLAGPLGYQFSGSVLVARDGEILLSKGYNFADQAWEIPNSPQTKFRIASLTKQFTATAILVLQERNLLNVQDPICQHYQPCPAGWQDILIEHLLTHTSGLPDLSDLPDYSEIMVSPCTPGETIQLVSEISLDFSPGTSFRYSNINYIVLGEIIHQTSGKSYEVFLQENIFEPVGMVNTGLEKHGQVLPQFAEGYINAKNKADFVHMSIPYSAGGLYSTIEDLYLWEQALFGGEILSSQSLETMISEPVATPLLSTGYRYGLYINTQTAHPMINHMGRINGFASIMEYYPDENLTIIILSNFESADVQSIAHTIAGVMFDLI